MPTIPAISLNLSNTGNTLSLESTVLQISLQIIALEVVREVVGNVGNCFRAQNHVQWQISNRQKLLALSSLDEGFN